MPFPLLHPDFCLQGRSLRRRRDQVQGWVHQGWAHQGWVNKGWVHLEVWRDIIKDPVLWTVIMLLLACLLHRRLDQAWAHLGPWVA